jgi:hypothetical protein
VKPDWKKQMGIAKMKFVYLAKKGDCFDLMRFRFPRMPFQPGVENTAWNVYTKHKANTYKHRSYIFKIST